MEILVNEKDLPRKCNGCFAAEKHVTTVSFNIRCKIFDKWVHGSEAAECRPEWCNISGLAESNNYGNADTVRGEH